MARWIIHIGAPKTGSTAIQRLLFEHRQALPAYGIQYPDVNLRGYAHHDLAFLLSGGYPEWATPQARSLADLHADLLACLSTCSVGTIVLSSENFYLYPRPRELHQWLATAGLSRNDDVTIVCYVRRQDHAHVSWYNQTVKAQGNSTTFEATTRLHRDLWDYADRLAPWQAEFGTSSILVRDYTQFADPPGDVCQDFAAILGLPNNSVIDFPLARVNERINRDILEFQRLVNRLPLTTERKRRYHKQLMRLTAATSELGVFDDSPFLTVNERAKLVESYSQSNKLVAMTYLGRERLFEPVSLDESGIDRDEGGIFRQPCQRPHPGLTPRKMARIVRGMLDHRVD